MQLFHDSRVRRRRTSLAAAVSAIFFENENFQAETIRLEKEREHSEVRGSPIPRSEITEQNYNGSVRLRRFDRSIDP